jgi:predicted GNAT family acetyltransferase
MTYEVKHNPEASRFEIDLEGKVAHADYHLSGSIMTVFHVYTPPEFRGKGIAAQVAKYTLDYCRANNLKVVPQCPYMHQYIVEHQEYQDLVFH